MMIRNLIEKNLKILKIKEIQIKRMEIIKIKNMLKKMNLEMKKMMILLKK